MASAAQTLARALERAAAMHEASFDTEAARAALDAPTKGLVNYANFYRKTLAQCCIESNSELAEPIRCLLSDSWNNALEWAKGVK